MTNAVGNEGLANVGVERYADTAQTDAADLGRRRITDAAGIGAGRCYRCGINAAINRYGHFTLRRSRALDFCLRRCHRVRDARVRVATSASLIAYREIFGDAHLSPSRSRLSTQAVTSLSCQGRAVVVIWPGGGNLCWLISR